MSGIPVLALRGAVAWEYPCEGGEGVTPNYAGLRADFNMVARCRLTL